MLLAVDKPTWITSYDAIRALKKIYWKQKIGHSWTLDPMATGLLLIGVGKWTKQLNSLQWLDKTYTTTIDFSKMSDTWDLDYWEIFEEYKLDELIKPSQEEIEILLNKLIPEYLLPLTPFSAKKKDGKKLYELAREWKEVNEERIMRIHKTKIISYTFPELELELEVGSWTYIRSIWYRLGQELKKQKIKKEDWKKLWGILTQLRRESIWDYRLKNINLTEKADRWDKKTEQNLEIKYAIVEE